MLSVVCPTRAHSNATSASFAGVADTAGDLRAVSPIGLLHVGLPCQQQGPRAREELRALRALGHGRGRHSVRIRLGDDLVGEQLKRSTTRCVVEAAELRNDREHLDA